MGGWPARVGVGFRASIAVAAASLLSAGGAGAALRDNGDGSLADVDRGLAWTADPGHVVTAGLAPEVVLPRARALQVLATLNAGHPAGLGHRDWRLPTPDELRHAFAAEGVAATHPRLFASWRALQRRTGAGRPGTAGGDPVLLWPVRGYAVAAGFERVVLFATNSIRIKNGAAVTSGDVVVNAASPGPTLAGGHELVVEPQATAAAGTRLAADSVWLKTKSVVGGDVAYNQLVAQGTVLGSLATPLALPVFPLLPAFVVAPPDPGSPPVTVAAGSSQVLAAGDYDAVTVGDGGTLRFAGGSYAVASIDAGKGARLLFDASSQVRVAGRLAAGKGTVIGPEPAAAIGPSDVVFFVAGLDGESGVLLSPPLAAAVGPDCLVAANFYVANGTLRLGQGTDATGAFLARDVLVENRARLTLDSHFFNRSPVAGDDAITVDEGGTATVLDSGAASVLANDSDPDGDPLTAAVLSGPAHGTLALAADGTFSYAHDGSETTADGFTYAACDDGTPALCDTATVSVVVTPVNDPPVALPDAATVGQGGSVSLLDSGAASVLANDSDPEGGSLSVDPTPVTPPAHGTLTLAADGTFTYVHSGSETTSDAFAYAVCDDGTPVACATATVSITVGLSGTPVSVLLAGAGSGVVTSTPAGIDCGSDCTSTFASGPVALAAVAAPGSAFAGFSGDADCSDGVLTLAAATTCVATFDLAAGSATLTVAVAGSGSGTVVGTPPGISCPGACAASYPVPSRVELTAIAAPGSDFVGWSGHPDCADGMVDLFGDTHCTATFDPEPPPAPAYTLTLDFQGGGLATVTSNPAGALCEEDCTVSFPQGTTVDLFVRPLEGTFTGWGGDCGAGTAISATVTLDSDKTCTVTIVP